MSSLHTPLTPEEWKEVVKIRQRIAAIVKAHSHPDENGYYAIFGGDSHIAEHVTERVCIYVRDIPHERQDDPQIFKDQDTMVRGEMNANP